MIRDWNKTIKNNEKIWYEKKKNVNKSTTTTASEYKETCKLDFKTNWSCTYL